jgi:hypothetical protein
VSCSAFLNSLLLLTSLPRLPLMCSYCNSNLFLLFRLYGILYDRLKNARALESPSMRQVTPPSTFAPRPHIAPSSILHCLSVHSDMVLFSAPISSPILWPRPYRIAVRAKALIQDFSAS